MLSVNDIYQELKLRMIEQQIIFNEWYVGMAANMLYQIFGVDKINQLFDKYTSGDHPKPGASSPPLHTGKGEAENPSAVSPSTRTVIIDKTPHQYIDCRLIIAPGEKYVPVIRLEDENGNTLPRPYFEAKHIICPRD